MKKLLLLPFLFLMVTVYSQKKVLNHSDYDLWNTIRNQSISNNGEQIMYSLERGEKDRFLKIKNTKAKLLFEYERVARSQFTFDSKFAIFSIKAWKDSIVEMKRRKVKKSKMPKDTLGIYDVKNNSLTKIANVKSYKVPEKWSGYVAYLLDAIPAKKKKKSDKSKDKNEKKEKKGKKKPKKKAKRVSKKNGYHLVLRNLETQKEDTIRYVTNYTFAKKGKALAYITTGEGATKKGSVHVLDIENNKDSEVFSASLKSKYYNLTLNNQGNILGFVIDRDSTKALVRPNELFVWKSGNAAAEMIVDQSSAPKGYRVSSTGRIQFSKDNSKLYFGLATPPIVKDTTLIKEEIVNVEVWAYDSPRLYTVQELQARNDRRKSYTTAIHLNDNNKLVQIATKEYPNSQTGNEGNAAYALVANPVPYQLESQWTAIRASDYEVVNTTTGERTRAFTNFAGRARLSPNGKFAYGYHSVDSTWYAYDIAANKTVNLTKGKAFYNELNDTPNHPWPYGLAGWTKDDANILLYDRYDIFSFNPKTGESKKLTNGRSSKRSYRYARLDREERFLDPSKKWLFLTFDEETKNSGYYQYDARRNRGKQLFSEAFRFSNPIKAKNANKYIFTRQSFVEFPDLRVSDANFKKQTVISNANPQQKDYNWGTIELVKWTSSEGKNLTGLLVKPENFDPNKKYPLLVNFYERSSDRLHSHRVPRAERSSINYSFYTSRGYVIFNPDVVYRDGYPGESAYNSVISGVSSIVDKGFIDKSKIGAQGHSWGGYQVAHLVTKTDIFAAVESGAPVVNMISAYGGIRWWTGLSRQFQYEHTQSRIGGTPWEYPMRYIENSPIFNIDKINTPLLIMHNDADGHVPWYQGIEFFTALRRLGKPSWFLNYNNEPHWPLKMQNRKDFNIRMAQFFDYYLKDAPKPMWMKRGVPAIEKGINQGYELIDKE